MIYSLENLEELYNKSPHDLKQDLNFLEQNTNGRYTITNQCHPDWLIIATYHKHEKFINMFLKAHNVPDGLTFKEQLCWLQLFKE